MTKIFRTRFLWLRSGNPKSKIKNRNLVRLLAVVAFTVSGAVAQAQQTKKVPRVGYLSSVSPDQVSYLYAAFLQSLRDLGYIEGENIVIESRWAEGKMDRLPDLATELVRLKVDVIVTAGGTPVAQAAKEATNTIPIVFTGSGDAVVRGLVASLAKPGGNITGLSFLDHDLAGKRLEVIREAVPKISSIAYLWDPGVGSILKSMEVAARALGVQLRSIEVRSPNDLEGAFGVATRERARALSVAPHPIFTQNRTQIVELAAKHRLPAIYAWKEFVEIGGLMSYGVSLPDLYRRAATYVDKILKGTKPADLPIEQPTKFELWVNLKAAKQIGLTIPPNVLVRADRVIR
jgi:putative ABC transport system substrate-binding protein